MFSKAETKTWAPFLSSIPFINRYPSPAVCQACCWALGRQMKKRVGPCPQSVSCTSQWGDTPGSGQRATGRFLGLMTHALNVVPPGGTAAVTMETRCPAHSHLPPVSSSSPSSRSPAGCKQG